MRNFRNIDVARWPQKPRVEWNMVVSDDNDSTIADYEIDPKRAQAWRDGDWYFIGVQAKATVYVPIGGGSFARYELLSPGLWAIESDSDSAYYETVYQEERAALQHAFRAFGLLVDNAEDV